MRRGILFLALIGLMIQSANAQTIADTSMNLHMVSFHMSGNLPGGDISNSYGAHMGIGGSYMFKTQGNWMLSADLTFIAGSVFKADSIFNNLIDEYGDFINTYGEIGEVNFYERGFYTGLKAGRLFPIFGPNPNSGLLLTLSGGLLQYKTLVHQDGRDIPSIIEDYSKGYDRLTNGFGLSEFIGYLHLDSHDPINFYVGLEFTQAWTKNRRSWNFDLMGPENQLKHDYIFGIRFGWIFPINKKATNTYYFY